MSKECFIGLADADAPEGKKKGRVLIYDDNAAYAEECAEMLWHRGYSVATRNSDMDFLKQIQDFVPDYLILDIHMPAFDGLEALRALRKQDLGAMAVIVVSSAGQQLLSAATKLAEAHQVNLLATLEKPLDIDFFENLISTKMT